MEAVAQYEEVGRRRPTAEGWTPVHGERRHCGEGSCGSPTARVAHKGDPSIN
jgi:hypothetical protein